MVIVLLILQQGNPSNSTSVVVDGFFLLRPTIQQFSLEIYIYIYISMVLEQLKWTCNSCVIAFSLDTRKVCRYM